MAKRSNEPAPDPIDPPPEQPTPTATPDPLPAGEAPPGINPLALAILREKRARGKTHVTLPDVLSLFE